MKNPLLCSGDAAAAAALDKATGAYREERRAYRMLKRQAILGRAERALQMLARMVLGFRVMVGGFFVRAERALRMLARTRSAKEGLWRPCLCTTS